MIKVSNGKCVRALAGKSLRASKTRNLVAVIAIALTALLFTALFTVGMSINTAFQESNFRLVGGYMHGGFKSLTPAQYDELKDDPLIREYGPHRFLGLAADECFAKSQVELHYYGGETAQWAYLDPVEGRLPREGTDEAAADLEVLGLLGVEPELGTEFSVTVDVGGAKTVQTFTLSGWWEADAAASAHIVAVPNSRVDAALEELDYEIDYSSVNGGAGTWQLEVMLPNARHIEEDLNTILARHGYQSWDPAQDNYIDIGVNWGYTGSQLAAGADFTTVFLVAVLLALIVLTGYLIIYNVFRISVAGDIRFYGLLKTIGTTGRQIKRLIRWQALALCVGGIPLGLALGWLTGAALAPAVLKTLNNIPVTARSASLVIFLGAAAFSLCTVLISCAKPGRIAARVSPVEAVRYAEGGGVRKKARKSRSAVSPLSMAWANLGRSRGKTAVTILSLSLAVVLLCLTVLLAGGFDMEKYLENKCLCDFMLADSSYFHYRGYQAPLDEAAIAAVTAQGGIADGGRMYTAWPEEFVSEEDYRASYWYQRFSAMDPEGEEASMQGADRDRDGRMASAIELYGGEDFILDELTVVEGDISKLYEPGGRYIAAIYMVDDYGVPLDESAGCATVGAGVGDTVTLRHTASYTDPATGRTYTREETEGLPESMTLEPNYTYADYEVAALVTLPDNLSSRHYGVNRYIVNAQTLLADAGGGDVLYYAFDTDDGEAAAMEEFIADYTANINPSCDYESRAAFEKEFEGFRGMFLLLGGVLSFVVALVGLLNFINAIVTGITSRRRELAMLQSVGQTGRQLRAMLVWEGMLYAVGSGLAALVLSAALEPAAAKALETAFWFFSYHFTVLPAVLAVPVFALLGLAVPAAAYRGLARRTIVERLRETE